MSGPKFFQTHMGKQFFEVTLPRAVNALNRIADNISVLATEVTTLNRVLEQANTRPAPPDDTK